MEARFDADLGDVRLHTDADADRAASAERARAFTLGRDIYFAAGRYAPETIEGRTRIAHELVHVQQQSLGGRSTGRDEPTAEREARTLSALVAGGSQVRVTERAAQHVQRDDGVVNMAPLTVTSTLRPTGDTIGGLDHLRGEGHTTGEITMARDDATIARNSPDPARALPFTTGGWDAPAILTSLGQYDTLPGTDSDAIRCVQAVALASRIVDGPAAVTGFIDAMILQGMLGGAMSARQRTATAVLEHVKGRIEMTHATFGDLIWAQEALHDLFYNDVSGTPEAEIPGQLAPSLELGRSMQSMAVWCDDPARVIAEANRLAPGEQLFVNTWQVVFNTAFDDLSEQGIEVAEGRSMTVEVNGRRVRITRIPTGTRPAHAAIDPVRDNRQGHQLMVYRDAATKTLRLYEPEITDSGRHLEALAADGSNFARYFRDLPDVGVYNYIQILGKVTPSSSGASGAAPTPP